jgi:hypothetical protein
MMNFSSCFWPLHPHPQSLKIPMSIFDIYKQKKTYLKLKSLVDV